MNLGTDEEQPLKKVKTAINDDEPSKAISHASQATRCLAGQSAAICNLISKALLKSKFADLDIANVSRLYQHLSIPVLSSHTKRISDQIVGIWTYATTQPSAII